MRATMGLLVAISAGVVLAGCGGPGTTTPAANTGGGGPASSAAAVQEQLTKAEQDSVRYENIVADCMKAQGFQYVAHPAKYEDPDKDGNFGGRDPSLVPYETLKIYRQKYGFAIFARDAFPQDPSVGNRPVPPNPNKAIRDRLDPARQTAYDDALHGKGAAAMRAGGKVKMKEGEGGCSEKASREVYPVQEHKPDPAKQAEYQRLLNQFHTDPQLVAASRAYGECLRRQGYQVESTKPGTIESSVQQKISAERQALGDKIDGGVAQQGLQREIKAALDDLECGKDYLKLAKPFMEKLLTSEGGNG